MDADLSLHDRFVLTALTGDNGSPRVALRRWEFPVFVEYHGPSEYRQDVSDHLYRLSEITGLWVRMDADLPTMIVEISDRETPSTCRVDYKSTPDGWRPEIHIWSELQPPHIRRCILQEITQALGPGGDLDGRFRSRSDTVFASFQTADHLTEQDVSVLRILYDDRLYHGMPRADVLAILPAIVADVEAQFR